MAYAPYEFLWLVKESSYGTPMASPSAGTDSIYIRLAGANRFTPRKRPKRRSIAYGGGFATDGYEVSDQEENVGVLQVELCYTQAKFLFGLAATRINSGQTSPWVTTEPAGDLASVSAYHGIMYSDTGAILRKLYSGMKSTSWALPLSADAGIGLLNLGLRAKRTAATDPTSGAFAAPADTAFPTDAVLFSHFAGGISVAGSPLSYANSFNASAENMLDARYFQTSVLAMDRLRGRKTKVEIGVLKTASPNWRTPFEGLTPQAITATGSDGTGTLAFDFKGQNLIATLEDDLTPGKLYDQVLGFKGQWDPSVSNDVVVTVTP